MRNHGDVSPAQPADFAAFLRQHRERILEAWEEAVRDLLAARHLPQPQLRNFIPGLLDSIADMVEQFLAGRTPDMPRDTAERHALDRLEEGFDLVEVVSELSLLRDCILELWQGAPVPWTEERAQQRVFSQAVDRAIVASIERYTRARDRILRAMDRVSTALEAHGVDEVLQRLIAAFHEEVPEVDSVAILLFEDDVLTVRAAAGLDEDLRPGLSMRVGEGFAGTVAKRRAPLHLGAADRDPMVRGEAIRARGIKALYGVPLIDGGDLIGVAHMGSCTAYELSDQVRVLFSSMAARATAGIYQQLLRDKAEQRARQLEESERRFEATFDNAAVGICHNTLDGRWLRLNRIYCEILGYEEDELRNMRFQDLTHPDDLAADLANLRRLVDGEIDGYTMEKRYLRKDGSPVWVDLSVSMVRPAAGEPYLVAAARDITRERALRDRLAFLTRASETLGSTLDVQRTLESVAELAVPFVADGCAVDLLEPGGALGDHVAVAHRDPAQVELFHELRRRYPPSPDDARGVARVVRTGEAELDPWVDDELRRRVARDPGHLELMRRIGVSSFMCVPLVRDRRPIGSLSLVTNDPRRSFGEDDLELARELARRASVAIENARLHEESELAVRLRDQILGVVSHDLRNPIATISLAANVLLRDRAVAGDSNATRQLGVIQRATSRANRLINDLLDVSSIQSGKLALQIEVCDMESLVSEVVETHEPLAAERGIDLRWRIHLGGRRLRADRDRLLQALGNLVGNALKFCTREDTVLVDARAMEGRAVIAVIDSGPGIAGDEIEHIFDLYWKGQRGHRGTGLGLFITQGIVESHGGSLRVDSKLGVGSTFTVELPLSESRA